ncbi:hypothetical protein G6F44_012128 [Rhizopus delemar]|nr:hypothetical protein G6F44_012128 [Rhizopus delemar]
MIFTIHHFYPGFSEISQALLRQPCLCDSVTNRSYRRGQELFVLWALQHNVSITDFSPVDLTNFLSHLYISHNFMLGTLRLARAAVTHLHHSPDLIRQQSDNPVSALLDALAAQALPRPQYKPEVNLSKTLKYLTNIPSSRSTPLNTLQKKVALLLEKRKKQRIIKTLTVHPHAHNSSLCPVAAFIALHDHTIASSVRPPSSLFVKSTNPNRPVQSTTISTWIRNLVKLSTSEKKVSLRSVAASLALDNGMPLQDIITLAAQESPVTSDSEDNFEDAPFDFQEDIILSG